MLTTNVEQSEPQRMQALTFEAPAADDAATHVRTVPVPPVGAGEVAIDVEFAGVNFKDVMTRRGDAGYAPSWPFVPGLEVAGRVRAVGAEVTGFRVGQHVAAYTGAGGLAEVAVADARLVVPVPGGVPLPTAAAATGVLVTAQLLLHEIGRIRPQDRVMVHGAAGGVGAAVAAIGRAAGVTVLLGSVGDEARIGQALALGYDDVWVRNDALGDRVIASGGADLVLDPLGTAHLDLDLRIARPGGRIVLFGNASGRPFDPLPPLPRLLMGNVALAGFSLAGMAASTPSTVAGALVAVLDGLAAGLLQLEPEVVDGLHRAHLAHQALAEGRGSAKYVVRVR